MGVLKRYVNGEWVTLMVGGQGPPGTAANTIPNLTDVDLTNLADGAVLVYSTTTNKWIASTTLNNQTFECGQY